MNIPTKRNTTFLQQIGDDFSVVLSRSCDKRCAAVTVRLVNNGFLRILDKLRLFRGQHRKH